MVNLKPWSLSPGKELQTHAAGGLFGLREGLGGLKKRKISCHYLKSNHRFSFVKLVRIIFTLRTPRKVPVIVARFETKMQHFNIFQFNSQCQMP
jgi:hypothetical protein